ncbi:MAG: bile acid:sodium symporter [Gemmataceae bacterium]|nr:bile acid:sodium symporter [Gemmataceae bacterium]
MFDFYPDYEYTFAAVQLVAFMLAMGAKLHLAQFKHVLRQPRSFLVALAGHLFVMPLVALAVSRLFQLEAGIAVGLILVAAMPGGTLAKIFTYFGHGNVALAIVLSVVSTLLTIVTVPLLLRLLTAGLAEDLDLPIETIIREVILFLLLPLGVSMLLCPRFPFLRELFATWGVRLGLVIVVIMVVGSLGSGRIEPGAYGWRAQFAIIVFCVLGQQLVQVPFYVMRWSRVDRMAAGMEATMRNMNLALLLYASLFAGNPHIGREVLFVILYHAAAAMVAGLPLALRHRRIHKREQRHSRTDSK